MKLTIRFLAVLLAAATILALPCAASAEVLPGYTSKVDYDNTDPSRYYIEIDLTNQVITVYEKDAQGTYSTVAAQCLCTTGNKENPTGAGTFKLGDLKERFGYFVAFGQYAQYWTQVVRGIYIHSVMYNSKKLSSMSKNAYNTLGTAASHGCVRVMPEVAQFIYYNCPPGTTCKVTRKAKNEALVRALKAAKPSYKNYVQPTDSHRELDPVPGTVRIDNVPLRTGFSSRDTTVATLKAGDNVDILQISKTWLKVKTQSGKLGYVKTSYVLFDPDAEATTVTVYKTTAKTYLYDEMDTGSERLVTLKKGTEVTVTDNPVKGWYEGSVNGITGFFRTRYVKPQKSVSYPKLTSETTSQTQTQTATQTQTQTATQTETRLPGVQYAVVKSTLRARYRDLPSMDGKVLGVLDPGTLMTVLGTYGNWYEISVNGSTGYISSTCVDLQ